MHAVKPWAKAGPEEWWLSHDDVCPCIHLQAQAHGSFATARSKVKGCTGQMLRNMRQEFDTSIDTFRAQVLRVRCISWVSLTRQSPHGHKAAILVAGLGCERQAAPCVKQARCMIWHKELPFAASVTHHAAKGSQPSTAPGGPGTALHAAWPLLCAPALCRWSASCSIAPFQTLSQTGGAPQAVQRNARKSACRKAYALHRRQPAQPASAHT